MEHVTETVEQMYCLYHQDIVHFFAEHLSDRDICWDLCHEVFMRLLLAQAAGMSLGKPRRWLMRVATNLLVDTYRQRAVSRAHVVPLSEDLSVKLVDAKAFWSLIEREDLLERITPTVRQSPSRQCSLANDSIWPHLHFALSVHLWRIRLSLWKFG